MFAYLAVTLTAAIRTEEAHLTEKFGARIRRIATDARRRARRVQPRRGMRNREYRALLGLVFVLVVLALKIRLANP